MPSATDMTPRYSFLHRLLHLIAPAACVCCGRVLTQSEQFVCSTCLRHLPYTGQYRSAEDNPLAQMFYTKLPVVRAAALYQHLSEDRSARIIYDIKYGNHPELARYMGALLAEEFAQTAFFDGITAIVPVPLTGQRLRKRGYNQSEWLAKGMAQATGISIRTDWVKRIAFGKSQTRLSHEQRINNVKDAFQPKKMHDLSGEHVLLVDDVITTGATMEACARVLVGLGAGKISIATLCQTKI